LHGLLLRISAPSCSKGEYSPYSPEYDCLLPSQEEANRILGHTFVYNYLPSSGLLKAGPGIEVIFYRMISEHANTFLRLNVVASTAV